MKNAPVILTAPGTETKGADFYDYFVTLSDPYSEVILQAGGLPLIIPMLADEQVVAEYVRRCDGIYLTGGDDIQPELYEPKLSPKLRKTVSLVDARRDLLEILLIREAFAQRKPLLAICRGHQILNVALGGTLIVDIPSQVKTNLRHSQLVHKDRVVHKVTLEEGSMLANVFGCKEIEVNSSHHQAIDRVAEPLRVTGRSPDGIIEVVELHEKHRGALPYLLSVQFHPERLVRAYPDFLKLFQSFTAACAARPEQSA
jgi:putative glutamine amidotransferase